MMVGYELDKTTTDNGHVARGICEVTADGYLTGVTERTHIISTGDGPLYTEDGETYHRLPSNILVSMNMWGFTPSLLTALEAEFPRFLSDTLPGNPMKAEFFLPTVVNDMLQDGTATVQVLPSADKWYGVTYQEDKPLVMAALRRLAEEEHLYPTPLWS